MSNATAVAYTGSSSADTAKALTDYNKMSFKRMPVLTLREKLELLAERVTHMFKAKSAKPALLIKPFFKSDSFTISKRTFTFREAIMLFGYKAKTFRHKKLVAALFAAILISTGIIVNDQISYAVWVNGEMVGTVETKAEYNELVEDIQQQANVILGHESNATAQISYSAELSKSVPAAVEEEQVLENLDGICEMYTLLIDGEEVGIIPDMDAFQEVLDGYMERYSDENTMSQSFEQTVDMKLGCVNSEDITEMDEIQKLLDPENSDSPYALKVRNVQRVEMTGAIPFETEYYNDDTIYEGDEVVTREGEDGVELLTLSVITVNGEEIDGSISDTETVKEPVNELIAVGTKERPKTASYGTYIWPTEGTITSEFGYRDISFASSNHKGLDIAADYGDPIYAADGGEVIYSGELSTYGNMIQVLHDNGDKTFYAHCSKLLVSVGERVYQGQQIAEMGETGRASGVHLHFEIRKDDSPVNPLKCLP